MESDIIELFSVSSRADAEGIKLFLSDHDIHVLLVSHDPLSTAYSVYTDSVGGDVEIKVLKSEFDAAIELLKTTRYAPYIESDNK